MAKLVVTRIVVVNWLVRLAFKNWKTPKNALLYMFYCFSCAWNIVPF